LTPNTSLQIQAAKSAEIDSFQALPNVQKIPFLEGYPHKKDSDLILISARGYFSALFFYSQVIGSVVDTLLQYRDTRILPVPVDSMSLFCLLSFSEAKLCNNGFMRFSMAKTENSQRK